MSEPILLVGMPRSGTTWIAKIVDSHPSVLYRHEPDSASPWRDVPLFSAFDDVELQERVSCHLGEIELMRGDRVAGKLPLFQKDFVTAGAQKFYELTCVAQKLLAKAGVQHKFAKAPMPAAGKPYRLAWKSIESLGRVGLIQRGSKGQLRIVHIIRHPCGYVSSVMRGEAASKFGGTSTVEDRPLHEMLCATERGKHYGLNTSYLMGLTPEERLAWRWRLVNEKAMDELKRVGGGTSLYYERFCSDPLNGAKDLFERLGLNWNPQSEAFVQSSTSRDSGAYYSVFKDPQSSAWKWQDQLTGPQIERILSVVSESEVARPYHSGEAGVTMRSGH